MFILYDKKMNVIEYPDGLIPLDIFISSISKQRNTDRVEGSSLLIDRGYVYDDRDITLNFLLEAKDTQDYRLLRDEVYALFDKHDEYYVVEEYQPGKRYLISVDEKFIPERLRGNQRIAEGSVNCTKLGLPFAESIGTTQDIQRSGLTYSAELWSYGMGLQYDDDTHKYTHATPSFSIFNAGSVPIHPFEQDLKITISGATGSNVTLKNTTTGDEFKYTESPNGKVIVLDGANITANNLQTLRDTNKRFITLAPGNNDFTVTSGAKVEFDFRFNYL